MRIVSDSAQVSAAVGVIETTVVDHGGYVHPNLTVNHDGPHLWLSLPRRDNPLADEEAGDKPAADAPIMLRIPNDLHIPVTDLDWDIEATTLRYRGDDTHLSTAQRTILAAMVDLFNACGKVQHIGTAYAQVALTEDPALLAVLQEARPGIATGRKSPVELVVASRQRSEMGEGDDGPIALFMPMIDMLNHHPYGSRYERNPEGDWVIRVHHPESSDQVFVRYNKADSLGVAVGLGYSEAATRFVASVAATLEVAGIGEVRVLGVGTTRRRLPTPKVAVVDGVLRVAGLMLQADRLPVLQQLLAMPLLAGGIAADLVTASDLAARIISGVLAANRDYYLRLQEICRATGPRPDLRRVFGEVAGHQLALLAAMTAGWEARTGTVVDIRSAATAAGVSVSPDW